MFGKSVNINWIYYIILLLVLFVAPLKFRNTLVSEHCKKYM